MFEDLTFNMIFKNIKFECKHLGKLADHNKHVKDLHHCNHKSKLNDNFNWACTIESCPYFDIRD